MAKGPKGFSDLEKEELKTKLCDACKKSWALHGYKKTSVGELTSQIGISTGSFYLLYPAKEDLFCDALERIRYWMKSEVLNIASTQKGKLGFIKSIQWQFMEYNKYPFLYDFDTPDFLSFLNRIPKEKVDSFRFDGMEFFDEIIEICNLSLLVSKEKTYATISTLLYTVTIKDRLAHDHFDTFNFLLDSVVDRLFEEKK